MNPLDKAGANEIQEHGDTIGSENFGPFRSVFGPQSNNGWRN
jgi:hypothetical protein